MGNIIKERAPQNSIVRKKLPARSFLSPLLSPPNVSCLDLSSLVPLLCIGSFVYWGLLPEFVFQFQIPEEILQEHSQILSASSTDAGLLDGSNNVLADSMEKFEMRSKALLPQSKSPESLAILVGIVLMSMVVAGAAIRLSGVTG